MSAVASQVTDPFIRGKLWIRRLGVAVGILGFLVLVSGSRLYSEEKNETHPVCNYGYFGLAVMVVMAPASFLPVSSNTSCAMISFTALASVFSGLSVVVWLTIVAASPDYDLYNAKPGYMYAADLALERIEYGNCYNGPTSEGHDCTCYHGHEEVDEPFLFFCTQNCQRSAEGIYAMWVFGLLANALLIAIAVLGCVNGGCACCPQGTYGDRQAVGAVESNGMEIPTARPADDL